MKHVLECINEIGKKITIEKLDIDVIGITMTNSEGMYETIMLDQEGLFNLIGSLHHFQKQIKSPSNEKGV